jgi:hypothetical protein
MSVQAYAKWAEVSRLANQFARTLPAEQDWKSSAVVVPVCLCGKSMYLHNIETVKAPDNKGECEGFVLNEIEVRQWRDVRVKYPDN